MSGNNNGSVIISNVFWKFAERILAQLVSLIVSVVLARLLMPNDYGAIAMVTVFITIANVFVTEGIPAALIQKKDADSKDFSSVLYFNLSLSVGLYAALFFTAPYIADFYKMTILSPVLRVMGLRIIVASINSVQHAYVSRNMMFRKYFWSTLFGTLFSGVVGIGMAYGGLGVWALVAQYMINTTVDTIVLFVTVNWRPTLEFSWNRIKSLFKFGWKILFEGVANTIDGQLRNLIIGKVYTSSDLAYYTKSQQFPSLITTNITSSISSVLFPAMSLEQDDENRILSLLRKSVRVTCYVIFPLLTGLAVVATPFISIVLTDKWLECVPYLQLFCFTSALTVGMIPRHQSLKAIGRSDVFMIEHMFARIVSIVLLLVVYRRNVMAIAISGAVATVILTLTIMYTSKQYNGYGYKSQISDVLPTVFGCAMMGIPVWFIGLLPFSDVALLFIQIVVGIVIYVSYSKIFKLKEFDYLKNYMSIFVSKIKSK